MAATTDISWADSTWSPWWGCVKVSPGCFNCYADGLAARWGFAIWGPPATTGRREFGEVHWREPLNWERRIVAGDTRWTKTWRPPKLGLEAGVRLVFPSMCDPFELHPQLTPSRARLFDTIRHTPHLRWLLLTKRPELIPVLLPPGSWPNVWLGTSVENQAYAELRVPELLKVRDRVPVLFLSDEPQIGPITLRQWLPWLDWVITGGESGARHRPFDLDWARLTRDECAAFDVAWHYKQFGGRTHAAGGCLLDGAEIKEFPRLDRQPQLPLAA